MHLQAFVSEPCALRVSSDKGKVAFRIDLESSLAERDHLLAEVERVQAELQGEAEAPAEGEDAAVEEGAVTGTASTHAALIGSNDSSVFSYARIEPKYHFVSQTIP